MTIRIDLEHRFVLSYREPYQIEIGPDICETVYKDRIKTLCFTHAVLHVLKGDVVKLEIDQANNEFNTGSWICEEC